MTVERAQPTLRKSIRCDEGSGQPDPAQLSNRLRALALQAHSLVRATNGSASEPDSSAPAHHGSQSHALRQLTEVHSQIVQLQQSLRAQDLNGRLASYVAALRRRVEESLA
jgi:hypothetical protein